MTTIDLTALETPLFTQEGPQFYDAAFEYNRPWAQTGAGGTYQTFLTDFEELVFTTWISTYSVPFDPNASISDYDMRGYWKDVALPGNLGYTAGQHFPDKWKTPYSTSFSYESIYAKIGCPYHWHGDKLYNDSTGQLIFWAAYVPPPQDTAIEIMEHSQIDPSVAGKAFMGDIDMKSFTLYLSGKIRLKAFDQVMDARVVLTIDGSSTIEIDLNDDDRSILRSGTLSSRLDFKIDGLWWSLVAVKKDQRDTLTLTFESREIAVLRLYNTFIIAKRTQVTRAQFILRMIREVSQMKINVVIPELKKVQPTEAEVAGSTPPWQSSGSAAQQGGITANDDDTPSDATPGTREYAVRNLTVKSDKATKEQIDNANIILDQGVKMGASRKVLVCSIMTAIVESTIHNYPGGDRDSVGLFQQRDSWGSFEDRHDPRTAAAMFFRACLANDRKYPNVSYNDLCQLTQRSGTPYAYGKYQAEGELFVTAFGIPGGNPTSKFFDNVASPIPSPPSSVTSELGMRSQSFDGIGSDFFFYRGIPQDGSRDWGLEDSWTCIQRLANEVQKRAFMRLGVFWYVAEEYLFTDMQPIMNITESSQGVDYISFDYDRGKKYAQVTLSVRIGRWQAPPGSIVILQDVGPINGKWLVSDFRRSLFDKTAEVTLKKPLPELPEPSDQGQLPGNPVIGPGPGSTPNGSSTFVGAYVAPLPSPPRMNSDDRNLGGPEDHASRSGQGGASVSWESDQAYDFKANPGEPVYAVESGEITQINMNHAFEHSGNVFGIQLHLKGVSGHEWFYTHFENIKVKEHDKVIAGQQIGTVTLWTANPASSHLHFAGDNRAELDRLRNTT